jgi:hypothetical protein
MDRRTFLTKGVGGTILSLSGCLTKEGPLFSDFPYEISLVTVSSERTSPEYPYTIEPIHRVDTGYVEEDDSVITLEELPTQLQSVFKTARHDSYAATTLPDGTRRILNEYDLIDFGEDVVSGRYMGFKLLEVDLETPPRLSVTAELLDESAEADDPAIFELRAVNTSEEPLRFGTGPPHPFGVLYADDLLLWTDAYRENSHIHTENGNVIGWNDVADNVTLEAGEEVSEEYELHPERDNVKPGVFRLDEHFSVQFEGGRETVVAEVTIEIS